MPHCVPLTVDSVSQIHPCFETHFEILMEADTPFTALLIILCLRSKKLSFVIFFQIRKQPHYLNWLLSISSISFSHDHRPGHCFSFKINYVSLFISEKRMCHHTHVKARIQVWKIGPFLHSDPGIKTKFSDLAIIALQSELSHRPHCYFLTDNTIADLTHVNTFFSSTCFSLRDLKLFERQVILHTANIFLSFGDIYIPPSFLLFHNTFHAF